jgi:hypothetical protein
MTLSTGGFRQVVAFPPAPIATGWSDPCREGLAPSQEPCLSTAHDFITTMAVLKFSVHTTLLHLQYSCASRVWTGDARDTRPTSDEASGPCTVCCRATSGKAQNNLNRPGDYSFGIQ